MTGYSRNEDFFCVCRRLFSSPFSFCPHYDCGESPLTQSGLAFNSDFDARIYIHLFGKKRGNDIVKRLTRFPRRVVFAPTTGDSFLFFFELPIDAAHLVWAHLQSAHSTDIKEFQYIRRSSLTRASKHKCRHGIDQPIKSSKTQ